MLNPLTQPLPINVLPAHSPGGQGSFTAGRCVCVCYRRARRLTPESDSPRAAKAHKSEPGHRNGKRFFTGNRRPHRTNAPSTDTWILIPHDPRVNIARPKPPQASADPPSTRGRLIHFCDTRTAARVPAVCAALQA